MKGGLETRILSVCRLLEQHKVDYLLVGGTAVALNGYFRHSVDMAGELTEKPDIDIWYNPTYSNYFKVLEVIHGLGYDVSEWKSEKGHNPHKSVFKLEFDDFTIDFLPKIKALIKFSEARKRSDTIAFKGVPIHYMGYPDLIEDKKALGRQKDIQDIEKLNKFKKEK